MLNNILQNLFSLDCDNKHQIITILGLKMSIKLSKVKIGVIFSWAKIKELFWKYSENKGIVTIKSLCFTIKYASAEKYKDYINTLKYLEPSVGESATLLIESFKKKKGIVAIDEFNNDKKIYNELIKSINPAIIKKAEGPLRDFQMLELNFTKDVLSDIEKNTGIKAIMSFGTLLGAVRHNGFIPWDDDVDFVLMRPEYEKLKEYLFNRYIKIDTSEWVIKQYTNTINEYKTKYLGQIVVIENFDTLKVIKFLDDILICVDFFVMDYFNDEHNLNTLVNYVKETNKKSYRIEKFKDKFNFYKDEIIKNGDIVEDSNTIGSGIGSVGFNNVWFRGIVNKDDIFPLKKLSFEDTEFWAPNNPDALLKQIYNFYNHLPEIIPFSKHNVLYTKNIEKNNILEVK